jgi:NitT/TauT family transport system substrate-binding protein
MKILKLLSALLVAGLLLIGCQTQVSTAVVNVLVPTGAPSVLFVDMIENSGLATIHVVNGADPVMSELLNPNNAYDMIVAPIVSATKLQMEGKTTYKLIGIVSWGNLVILGPQDLDLNNAKLGVFAPQGVPGVISKHLLEKEGINMEVQAVGTMADAMALYVGGHVDAVLMAYPLAQTLIEKHDAHVLLDLQELYEKHYGQENYPQAGIYVSQYFYEYHKARIGVVMNQLTTTHNLNLSTPNRLNNIRGAVKDKLMMDSMEPMSKNYESLGLFPCYSLEKLNELNSFLNLFDLELQSSMIAR